MKDRYLAVIGTSIILFSLFSGKLTNDWFVWIKYEQLIFCIMAALLVVTTVRNKIANIVFITGFLMSVSHFVAIMTNIDITTETYQYLQGGLGLFGLIVGVSLQYYILKRCKQTTK